MMATQNTSFLVGTASQDAMTPMLVAVAVKLPTFWTVNPKAWFHQVEAQFALCNISLEETKYFYVISSLNMATSIRVVPFLLDLQPLNNYTDLKKLLLETYGLSND